MFIRSAHRRYEEGIEKGMRFVRHIVSEFKGIDYNEYIKWRLDKVVAIIYWKLNKKYEFECSNKYYEHVIRKNEKLLEVSKRKIL